jgi:hypothetical protein
VIQAHEGLGNKQDQGNQGSPKGTVRQFDCIQRLNLIMTSWLLFREVCYTQGSWRCQDTQRRERGLSLRAG